MTDTSLDELGPVDYVIVEFPEGQDRFTGEMVEELVKLAETGTIRLIDVLILVKDDDGSIEAMELADLADLGPLQALETELAELLAEEDVVHLAAAMDPGSTGWGRRLREPVGRAVRVSRTAIRWSAHRQRPDPHPSHHRRHRGGRHPRHPGELTCH